MNRVKAFVFFAVKERLRLCALCAVPYTTEFRILLNESSNARLTLLSLRNASEGDKGWGCPVST
ncbi:MAG: hypothetical protein LBG74_06235, partial [Spirochaetaceae bacterium]|nr:hypothetical protein [Spirochaetaceae bacterium]